MVNFGYCLQIEEYDPKARVIIQFNSPGPYYVYLTDKRKKTHYTLDFASQIGNPIIIKDQISYNFQATVKQISHLNPNKPSACENYDSTANKSAKKGRTVLTPNWISCRLLESPECSIMHMCF